MGCAPPPWPLHHHTPRRRPFSASLPKTTVFSASKDPPSLPPPLRSWLKRLPLHQREELGEEPCLTPFSWRPGSAPRGQEGPLPLNPTFFFCTMGAL